MFARRLWVPCHWHNIFLTFPRIFSLHWFDGYKTPPRCLHFVNLSLPDGDTVGWVLLAPPLYGQWRHWFIAFIACTSQFYSHPRCLPPKLANYRSPLLLPISLVHGRQPSPPLTAPPKYSPGTSLLHSKFPNGRFRVIVCKDICYFGN